MSIIAEKYRSKIIKILSKNKSLPFSEDINSINYEKKRIPQVQ